MRLHVFVFILLMKFNIEEILFFSCLQYRLLSMKMQQYFFFLTNVLTFAADHGSVTPRDSGLAGPADGLPVAAVITAAAARHSPRQVQVSGCSESIIPEEETYLFYSSEGLHVTATAITNLLLLL